MRMPLWRIDPKRPLGSGHAEHYRLAMLCVVYVLYCNVCLAVEWRSNLFKHSVLCACRPETACKHTHTHKHLQQLQVCVAVHRCCFIVGRLKHPRRLCGWANDRYYYSTLMMHDEINAIAIHYSNIKISMLRCEQHIIQSIFEQTADGVLFYICMIAWARAPLLWWHSRQQIWMRVDARCSHDLRLVFQRLRMIRSDV